MDLNGKNVIYIGGFGGIGQKCIREFLNKKIKNLAIFDLKVNAELLQELQQAFPDSNIFFVQLDITKRENIEAAYKEAAEKMGHFDVVVNGSGLMDDRFIDLTIQINLLGTINSTLTAIKYMDKSNNGNGGLIVNISSCVGLEPSGLLAVYSATKFAVLGFTRGLANPIIQKRTGINFITICPGITETALLENPGVKCTFDFPTPMADTFNRALKQTPDQCAKNMIKTIESAKNGSVWLLDMGEIKEIEYDVLWKPTFKS